MTSEKKAVDKRLSYSSATLVSNCQQKYWHYKVNATPKDNDYEENWSAFSVGKAFHDVLENCKHNPELFKPEQVKATCDKYECSDDHLMVHAMVLKYLKLNQKVGTKSLKEEFEISTDKFLGYVDVLMEDEKGYWWIVDLKTSAWFKDMTVAKLQSDTQLNLYSFFAKDFAQQFRLKMNKFGGARYRVTTKSKLKKKRTETDNDFIRRVYGAIRSVDVVIPASVLKPKEVYERHLGYWEITEGLRSGKLKPQKNLSYCDSFFRQCEYWSQCHKGTYTESLNMVEVIE